MDEVENKKRYDELLESLNLVYNVARMAPANANDHERCRAAAEKVGAFLRETLLPVKREEPAEGVEEPE